MEKVIIQKRKLPHIYIPQRTYFITYRLKGTYIDKNKSSGLQSYLEMDEKYDRQKQIVSLLKEAQLAEIVSNSLKYYDEKEYKLLCYCVMPNHVHVVFSLLEGTRGISKIMQSIKRYSASEINRVKSQSGSIWQAESYDHIIRNEHELLNTLSYVVNNPVKAGLTDNWEKWETTFLAEDISLY